MPTTFLRSRRRLLGVVVPLLLLLGTTACGDDGGGQELTVVGTEMAFDAPATTPGGAVTIRFENRGAIFHEVAVKDASGKVLRRTQAAPGRTSSMELTLQPGTYELGCFEPGHYEGGMHRLLEVT
jgi:uncharacterized cupredoxin-like copper-binding protein